MDSKVKVPAHLLNAPDLARYIWDYWVGEMRNRNITGALDFPFWDEMEDEERDAFILACQVQSVNSLKSYLDDASFEDSFEAAFPDTSVQAMPTPPMYTKKKLIPSICYTCGRFEVNNAGDICDNCYHIHVGSGVS